MPDTEVTNRKKAGQKAVSTLIKIAVSLLLLYFVFSKIGFSTVWALVKESNLLFLFLALLAFIASQWVSSLRLLSYFRQYGFFLSKKSNYWLYLIGMFYNFFIPGGIGGDAYKVYLLHKKFEWSTKKLTYAVLNDRVSGLLAIVLLLEILSLPLLPEGWKWLVPVALVLMAGVSFLLLKKLFPSFSSIYIKTLLYSLVVQLFQLLCLVFIVYSLGKPGNLLVYCLVFLASSVLSVFSFAGIGVREWLFLQASSLFVFDAGLSVSIALLFSVLTAFVSLFGLFFQLKEIRLTLAEGKAPGKEK